MKKENQARLLLALDAEKGLFNMAVLEPKAHKVHTTAYYKATWFTMDLDRITATDKMELYRQTEEILFREVMQSTESKNKLQTKLKKIEKKN